MRDQVLAPGTLSLERHRLLWLFLQQKTNFFTQPKTLMHVAPEQAFYHRFKAMEHLSVTSVDLYSPLADVKADLCALPFADDSFDVILCNHVLEHIPDDQKALSELYRVLKPGGWGVFQVPQDLSREVTFSDDTITDAKQRAAIFGQYDHVRIYGRDYQQRLAEAGFEVQMVDYTADLTHKDIDRYRLAAGELIPWVHKPLIED
jgi:SAM-dependent methyltransferase